MYNYLILLFYAHFMLPENILHAQSVMDVYNKVKPGLVHIRAETLRGKSHASALAEYYFPGQLFKPSKQAALGSGFVVDGVWVISSFQVTKGVQSFEIVPSSGKGKVVQAELAGSDPRLDISVLKLTDSVKLSSVTVGDSDSLRLGDFLLAIGLPFGIEPTLSRGMVAAKPGLLGSTPFDNYLHTDAKIHPGNNGGPLVDHRGRVVGIATTLGSGQASSGYVVPINLAKKIIADIQRHGKVLRSWLGVIVQNRAHTTDRVLEGVKQEAGLRGVIIENIVVASPAYKASLQVGDIIMAIDEEEVIDFNGLQRIMASQNKDHKVTAKVFRRGRGELLLPVQLEETPRTESLPSDNNLL